VSIARLIRALAVALILAPMAAPAFAGPAEAKYLESLVGTWRGAGKVSGEDAGNVSCRLTIRGSGERLSFTGRCSFSGGGPSQSFSGTIRYNDKAKRYESSASGETVVGKKSGSTLVFSTSGKSARGDATSTMSMSPNAIKVQFKLVSSRGQTTAGSIPFKKS
jgi:hypothetical protein